MPTQAKYQQWLDEAYEAKHELLTSGTIRSTGGPDHSVSFETMEPADLDRYITWLEAKVAGKPVKKAIAVAL